jgi:hypothetical protein
LAWYAAALLALLAALAVVVPAADAGAPDHASIVAASPGHYIASWKQRARQCPDLTGMPWTDWTTYAEAQVGNEWAITTGRKGNCAFAANAADRLIESLGFNDGAGFRKIDWQGYAITVGEGRTDDPIGHDKPRGWQCFALPSAWGATAWRYAELAHLGAPNDQTFGPAAGPAAGGGYCVSKAHSDSLGTWHGGSFLTWIPDVLRCKHRYHLKEEPVPGEPLEVTYPPYGEAQIWGDYERQPC